MVGINYKFLLDAYLGTGGFLDGSYIEPFPRETAERIKIRRRLAVNINLTKKIVNSIVGHVFRKSPIRKVESLAYQRFMEDTDKNESDIDQLMERIFRLGLVFGTVFVIVDAPSEEVETALQKEELEAYPYVALRLPFHLQSYRLDQYGRLETITFKEPTQPNSSQVLYRTYTRTGWYISTDPMGENRTHEGEHNLGIVPVIPYSPIPNDIPGEIVSVPFILEIAQIQKAIYNTLSELRSMLRDTSFPLFTFPVSGEADLEKLSKEPLTIGTENAIAYTPQGSAKPEFIAPPPEPAQQHLEKLQFLIEQAYELANMAFKGGVQKSGVAKEYDYLDFTKMLSNFARGLENLEYRIADLVCRWEGEEFKGWIEYPKEFTPLDTEKQTKTILELLSLDFPESVKKELLKKAYRLVLGDTLDEQRLNELDKDIDFKDDYEEKLRKEGLF